MAYYLSEHELQIYILHMVALLVLRYTLILNKLFVSKELVKIY